MFHNIYLKINKMKDGESVKLLNYHLSFANVNTNSSPPPGLFLAEMVPP